MKQWSRREILALFAESMAAMPAAAVLLGAKPA